MGMSEEVRLQFYLFGLALFFGAGFCFAYDLLRILRRLVRHSSRAVNGEDMAYWLALTAAAYGLLFHFAQGGLRLYIVFGVLFGVLFYSLTISQVFIHLSVRVLSPVFGAVRRFFGIFRRRPTEKAKK